MEHVVKNARDPRGIQRLTMAVQSGIERDKCHKIYFAMQVASATPLGCVEARHDCGRPPKALPEALAAGLSLNALR